MEGIIEQTTKPGPYYFGRMCRYYFQIPWSSSLIKSLPIGSFIVPLFLIDVNIDRYKIEDIRYRIEDITLIDLTQQWSEFVIASRKSGVAISSTEAGLQMHQLTWNILDFLC